MSAESILIERTYPVRIEKVWQAITDPEKLNEWFFKLTEFRLEKGFEFIIHDTKGKPKHRCCITDFIPGKMMAFSFGNIEVAGLSQVTYELFDEGANTRLQLTHTGLESFPLDQPGYQRKNFLEGWTYLFGTALHNYLEKNNVNQ